MFLCNVLTCSHSCNDFACKISLLQCNVYNISFIHLLTNHSIYHSEFQWATSNIKSSCHIFCIFQVLFYWEERLLDCSIINFTIDINPLQLAFSHRLTSQAMLLIFFFGNIYFSWQSQQCLVDWGYFNLSSFLNVLKMFLLRLFSSFFAEWNPSFVLKPWWTRKALLRTTKS